MSTVLVIGNGFDLALGYHTSYSHFANTWAPNNPNCFWPFKEPDVSTFGSETLHQHFYNYFNSKKDKDGWVRWLDIETELYNYAKTKIGIPLTKEFVENDKNAFEKLVCLLHIYLLRHKEHKSNRPLTTGEDKCVIELLKALNKDKGFKKAYTFNYTDLEEYLMKYGEFEENNIPDIIYVHGRLLPSAPYEPQIVLGINNDTSLPDEYSFLQKINNHYADGGDLAKDLLEADEVIFYGLSMGIVDFEYFQTFFCNVVNSPFSLPKKHITIFTKGANSVSSINRNIEEMGIRLRELKEHADFNIIDTQEAELTDNGHNLLFQKLIKRITS